MIGWEFMLREGVFCFLVFLSAVIHSSSSKAQRHSCEPQLAAKAFPWNFALPLVRREEWPESQTMLLPLFQRPTRLATRDETPEAMGEKSILWPGRIMKRRQRAQLFYRNPRL